MVSISFFNSVHRHPFEEKIFKTKVAIFVKYRYSIETVQNPHEQQLHLQLSSHFASAKTHSSAASQFVGQIHTQGQQLESF